MSKCYVFHAPLLYTKPFLPAQSNTMRSLLICQVLSAVSGVKEITTAGNTLLCVYCITADISNITMPFKTIQ